MTSGRDQNQSTGNIAQTPRRPFFRWLAEFFGGPEYTKGPYDPDAADRYAAMQIRATTIGALLCALIFVLIVSALMAGHGAGIVLVVGVGTTALCYVLGMLFSVPRVAAVSPDFPSQVQDHAAQNKLRLYSINTNLEQVSDWLTKIIVGVGLVEIRNIIGFLGASAAALGSALTTVEPSLSEKSATALSAGMIIAYGAIGFLLGFFSVRLYISRAIYVADRIILRIAPEPQDGERSPQE